MIPATLIEQELAAAQAAQQRRQSMGRRESVLDAPWHTLTEAWLARLPYPTMARRCHGPISGTFSKTHPSLFLSDKRPSD